MKKVDKNSSSETSTNKKRKSESKSKEKISEVKKNKSKESRKNNKKAEKKSYDATTLLSNLEKLFELYDSNKETIDSIGHKIWELKDTLNNRKSKVKEKADEGVIPEQKEISNISSISEREIELLKREKTLQVKELQLLGKKYVPILDPDCYESWYMDWCKEYSNELYNEFLQQLYDYYQINHRDNKD